MENESNLPKLIATDMYLPGNTGIEFLTDLKNMEKYKGIHVAVLSTLKTTNKVERYKQMGADNSLIKTSTYDKHVQVAKVRR
jgi:DNA-binding NarL/FixJ family response regulator